LSKLVRILLPVSHQGTTEACRDAAFRLATDFGAGLEVLHLCAAAWQRLPYSTELSPFYSQELIDIGRDQIVQEQAQAKAWFEQASRVHSCSTARFQTIEGFLTTVVTGRARVADLSVVPSIGEKDDEFWAGIRDAVLFQSGRPVLIVPDGASSAFGETVVVAWKDGVEAVRAVVAAAPFFAKGASVSLLSVAESDEDDTSLAAMAEYLTLSGLKVDASRIAAPAGDVAKTLLSEASAKPGALLVMGAYGHWRWREWVFGGVTQEVLRSTTLPVLMAH
jgi:nucleotide-binding universal stress UspA family protein